MSGLVRTAIGGFRIEDAVDPDGLNRDDWLRWLLPPLRAVECLRRVQLSADEAERIRNGLAILCKGKADGREGGGSHRLRFRTRAIRPESLPPSTRRANSWEFSPSADRASCIRSETCRSCRRQLLSPIFHAGHRIGNWSRLLQSIVTNCENYGWSA